MIKLADSVQEEEPEVAETLVDSRFVDDLGDSKEDDGEKLRDITGKADNLFAEVGLSCKGWTFSGSDPPEDVAEEGNTVSIGGLRWHPKVDMIEVVLPELHFSSKVRGRLPASTKVFKGTTLDAMNEFVPKHLTRRMIMSKNHSVFDLPGKLAPIMAGLKVDLSQAIKETLDWDSPVTDDLRYKWVRHFFRLEQLKGLKFNR